MSKRGRGGVGVQGSVQRGLGWIGALQQQSVVQLGCVGYAADMPVPCPLPLLQLHAQRVWLWQRDSPH